MFCRKCGTKIEKETVFCPYCGTENKPLTAATPPEPPSDSPFPAPKPRPFTANLSPRQITGKDGSLWKLSLFLSLGILTQYLLNQWLYPVFGFEWNRYYIFLNVFSTIAESICIFTFIYAAVKGKGLRLCVYCALPVLGQMVLQYTFSLFFTLARVSNPPYDKLMAMFLLTLCLIIFILAHLYIVFYFLGRLVAKIPHIRNLKLVSAILMAVVYLVGLLSLILPLGLLAPSYLNRLLSTTLSGTLIQAPIALGILHLIYRGK